MLSGKLIIRTVTHYYVGEVVASPPPPDGFLALRQCSWVADTGRWHVALRDGTLSEVEPYPAGAIVLVNLGAVVDIAPWDHELPTKAK